MTVRVFATACGVVLACASTLLPATAHGQAPPITPSTALPGGDDPQFRQRMLSWQAPPSRASTSSFLPPVDSARVSSTFGARSDPMTRSERFHAGVDLAGSLGTPIRASADGVVSVAASVRGYGNLIEIDHGGGLRSRYAHLDSMLGRRGATVARGDVIGLMGSTGRSTGNHVHYEVRIDGRSVDPLGAWGAVDRPEAERPVRRRWGGWETTHAPARLPTASIE